MLIQLGCMVEELPHSLVVFNGFFLRYRPFKEKLPSPKFPIFSASSVTSLPLHFFNYLLAHQCKQKRNAFQ